MLAQTNTARFNPARTPIKAMPNIEITEECRALIESAAGAPTGRRLPNGNWLIPVNEATLAGLQQVRLRGETISDCIIRLMIVALHKYGLQ
ncbi:hypothetical protein AAFX91_21465 [Bradyrhizobium sp. 31Argb]|uniref:hypothetical protein n=1 Tax=Bradyrhizobium sp. 31Argb TaxID=3141247 RepID=UPI00374A5E4F